MPAAQNKSRQKEPFTTVLYLMSTLLTEVLRRSRTRLAEVFLGKPTAKQVRQKEEAELWGKANDVIQDLLLKQRLSKVKEFRALMKPANGGGYERIAIGEYPRESDEVWVEANSEDPGIRHDDLVGFVVLSELRQFLATTKWVAMFYRNALKGGCEFPVGSEAIKFARRAK